MLKLKKVEIVGFKSFCDRTELIFNGNGITAIVGPNGCGKSNISDAINWVLGEQSAKSLRGGSMQDVIFNGTRDRQPTGMAEVTLTLLDTEWEKLAGVEAIEKRYIELGRQTAEAAAEAEIQATLPEVEVLAAEETPGGNGQGVNGQGVHGYAHGANGHANGHANGAAHANPAAHANGKANGHANGIHNRSGEIVVTRRLYRSGESEYALNGRLCRLRDIQDIFMGTGLGPESYAIIEQGRIGQILNSKPYDRRALIEEAAGVTKYKNKRRLAEAKLEAARQNLHRVNDILDEVGRQVNSLKRQASKARRFGELRDEFLAAHRVAVASRYAELERHATQVALELSVASGQLKQMSERVEALEQEQFSVNQAGYEREEALRTQRDLLASLAMEADRARNRIAYQQQQAAELEARLGEDRAQFEQLTGRLAQLEEEQRHAAMALEQAEAEGRAAQAEVAERVQAQAALEQAHRDSERSREKLRGALLNVMGDISRLRNQLTQVEEFLAGIARQRERAERDRAAAEQEEASLREQGAALSERAAQQQLELESVIEQRASVENRAGELKTELAARQRELEQVRQEASNLRARRDSLEQILSRHAYTGEAVKKLLSLQNDSFHAMGILADFIDVDSRYEQLVEDFLADELEYVVVKNWESANDGVGLLREKIDGRVTFMVEPDKARPPLQTGAGTFGFPQGFTPLCDFVRLTNGLAGGAQLLLPKLASCYLVEDADAGRELALAHPSYFFLSAGGACFHGSSVTGGRRAGAGPLALKRELRGVTQRSAELEAHTERATAALKAAEEEAALVAADLEKLRREQVEREKAKVGSDQEMKQLAVQLRRSAERLSVAGLELERLQHESSRASENAARLRSEAETRETSQAELEKQIERAEAEAASLAEQRGDAMSAAAEARARAAALEERRRGAVAAAGRLDEQLLHERARAAELERQLTFAGQEVERLRADNRVLETRSAAIAEQRVRAETEATELKAALEAGRRRAAELEEQVKAERSELDRQREMKSSREVALARLQSDMAHLAEDCVKDLSLPVAELQVDPAELLAGEALEQAEEQARQLRAKIDALGPVNVLALEEYQEAQQRFDFLNTQRQDLLDAIRDTNETIQEMDTVSRQQFVAAFEAINANFQESFRTLFGGGTGLMRLTEEANPGESGIELIVQPPGKRLQNVLLMSGGEKALTALSLLLAIFRYKPSPFCVLDEVDAPLDDTNIGRFTNLVVHMSLDTQFLIITHSKRTMEAAPVMYGVTMQEAGVSRLVSVKFKDTDTRMPPPPGRGHSTVATA